MPKITSDGYDFDIPEGAYSASDLKERAKAPGNAVPVVRKQDKDIVLEPEEVVNLQSNDRVTFTTPMEATGGGQR